MNGLALTLPPDALEAVAQRAAEIVLERLHVEQEQASPWLYTAKAAADYLGVPVGKVHKLTAAGAIPHRKVGQRVLYRRDELDAWLDGYSVTGDRR